MRGSTLSSLPFVFTGPGFVVPVFGVDWEQQAPMSRKTDKELEEPCYRYIQNGAKA